MKSKITVLVLAITLFSCSENKQKKAEGAVTTYLKTVLNDPSSYESVSFDSLKVDSSTVFDVQDYILAKSKYDMFQQLFDKNNSESKYETDYEMLKFQSDNMRKHLDSMTYYKSKMDAVDSLFKPQPIGFSISHKYRGKNKMGALILTDETFYLDSTFKVIPK